MTDASAASTPARIEPFKCSGRVRAVYSTAARGRLGFQAEPVAALEVDLEGIVGNRHRGWTRGADARVPYLKRGTTIRNERQLSLVSVEDLAVIARLLEITDLDPAWIGANVLVEGIAHLSYLPRGTHLFAPSGAILIVTDQNAPCTLAGEAISLQVPGRPDLKQAFPKLAQGLRGVVATVEHPGTLAAGDDLTARVPMQWIYPKLA